LTRKNLKSSGSSEHHPSLTNYNQIVEIFENASDFFEGKKFKLEPELFSDDWNLFRRIRQARCQQRTREGLPPASTCQRSRR